MHMLKICGGGDQSTFIGTELCSGSGSLPRSAFIRAEFLVQVSP